MPSAESPQTLSNLSDWKIRLEKELKSPLRLEDLGWEASEFFTLDPVYDASSLTEEHAYLNAFHEEWTRQRKNGRPLLKLPDTALREAGTSELKEAESYGFQAWVASGGRFPEVTLPVEYRAGNAPQLPHSGRCRFDPISDSLRQGSWTPAYLNLKTSSELPDVHLHGCDVHNAGGSAVQELAYCLLLAEQYRIRLSGEAFKKSAGRWVIHLGTGPSFFLEIAKIRAMRLLWMNFCSQNDAGTPAGSIESSTSTLFWSYRDPDSNLLRHTTEAMAAFLGGADSLLVHPHTLESGKGLEASRLAVNIGLLASEEAHLDEKQDPAHGSYLLEILTHHLVRAAWKLFTEWNEEDFQPWIESGSFQKQIQDRLKALQQRFSEGSLGMVGVNQHPSPLAKPSPPFPVFPAPDTTRFPPLKPAFLDA